MKNLIIMLALGLTLNVFSQHEERERIKALKVAFITERLDLSEKEAQEFWPIYNEYESKVHEIKYKDMRSVRRQIKEGINTMSNEEATKLIQKLISTEETLHQLKIELPKKLSNVISSKKMLQLKIAEDDFKRKMFEELRRRKKERS